MAANDKQVGGTHYASPTGHQHWDMVVDYQLNYFEGQITKYVMRARKKNGKQDLEKALHFLEKYIEVYDRLTGLKEHATTPTARTPLGESVAAGIAAMDGNFEVEGFYGDGTAHYKCVHCKALVRVHSLSQAYEEHGACARAHSQFTHP